jgi:hypothetical protein
MVSYKNKNTVKPVLLLPEPNHIFAWAKSLKILFIASLNQNFSDSTLFQIKFPNHLAGAIKSDLIVLLSGKNKNPRTKMFFNFSWLVFPTFF